MCLILLKLDDPGKRHAGGDEARMRGQEEEHPLKGGVEEGERLGRRIQGAEDQEGRQLLECNSNNLIKITYFKKKKFNGI